MRTLTTLGLLAVLTGTAAADHGVYRDRSFSSQQSLRNAPQNRQPQTEERYQERNKLADAGLSPYSNHAVVQLPQAGGSLDYLELRAGRTRVALRDVVVQFADGSTIHTGSRGVVEPFEGRVIDLPSGCAQVVAVMPEYETPGHGASLEVFGVHEHRTGWGYQPNSYQPNSYQPNGYQPTSYQPTGYQTNGWGYR
ncbi:MAG TPA: hypothetical protein VMZ53_14595 [Kofleriaceae bacterium]|nr:hypothetical protein [Kofleriaceae bacterium]